MNTNDSMKKPNLIRTVIFASSFLFQLGNFCLHSLAAAGDVDLSFDPGSGVDGQVNAIIVQPNGRILIGGSFSTVKGLLRTNLARLNADGSGDSTFDAGPVVGITAMTLQPDGKLLVAGPVLQTFCDESECYSDFYATVMRLNVDGSQDNTFTPALADYSSAMRGFRSLALLPDGKILVGGEFINVNGTHRNALARLHANGTLDTDFHATGLNGAVQKVVAQPDGKVLIAGYVHWGSGTNHFGLLRLNADGSFDPTFEAGFIANRYPDCGPLYACWESTDITALTLQPDGNLLVGVWRRFWQTPLDGSEDVIIDQYLVQRLNASGSNDVGFVFTNSAQIGIVQGIIAQPDGRSLVRSGGFNTSQIIRLNANGSWDQSFHSVAVPGTANAAALQPDGKILLGGAPIPAGENQRMARLNADGSRDTTFDSGKGLESVVSQIALQPDGKVLIGGPLVIGDPYFVPMSDVLAFVNGTNRHGRARLNFDGSPDSGFIPTPFRPPLEARYHTENCPGDPRYGCLQAFVSTAFLVQTNGKVLLGGYFITTIYGDETLYQVYNSFLGRFTATGGLEEEFNLSGVAVSSLAQQPDGKIVMGGSLMLNGTNSTVARLNNDGSVDASFQLGRGPAAVVGLALQTDGKIIVAGVNTVARLNSNGSVDPGFGPVSLSNGVAHALLLQPDGKVLVGGSFTRVNGTTRNRIARLNANGTLDLDFNPGVGADAPIRSMGLQTDGKIVISGEFKTINGVVRPFVARLYGDTAVPSLNIVRSNTTMIVSWPVTFLSFQLQETANLGLTTWSPIAQQTVTNGGQVSVIVPTSGDRKFFRLRTQ